MLSAPCPVPSRAGCLRGDGQHRPGLISQVVLRQAEMGTRLGCPPTSPPGGQQGPPPPPTRRLQGVWLLGSAWPPLHPLPKPPPLLGRLLGQGCTSLRWRPLRLAIRMAPLTAPARLSRGHLPPLPPLPAWAPSLPAPHCFPAPGSLLLCGGVTRGACLASAVPCSFLVSQPGSPSSSGRGCRAPLFWDPARCLARAGLQ